MRWLVYVGYMFYGLHADCDNQMDLWVPPQIHTYTATLKFT